MTSQAPSVSSWVMGWKRHDVTYPWSCSQCRTAGTYSQCYLHDTDRHNRHQTDAATHHTSHHATNKLSNTHSRYQGRIQKIVLGGHTGDVEGGSLGRGLVYGGQDPCPCSREGDREDNTYGHDLSIVSWWLPHAVSRQATLGECLVEFWC